MTQPTKENTLYLPIKQTYFDAIIEGTKKDEEREVKEGVTSSRYLLKDEQGNLQLNPDVTEQGKKYFVDDYNGGNFPFLPKPYKYLSLAVGYNRERDTALVEVTDITYKQGKLIGNPPKFCWWVQVFHLGKVVEVHRKQSSES